jgi:hypothetical protein
MGMRKGNAKLLTVVVEWLIPCSVLGGGGGGVNSWPEILSSRRMIFMFFLSTNPEILCYEINGRFVSLFSQFMFPNHPLFDVI